MPPSSSDGPRERDEVLSGILKAIRNARHMTVQQVADRMSMKKRSYERFEAGEGLLKAERIFLFAQATDSDPYAIWASVKLGAPDLALACMDNKLVMLLVAHARDLFRTQGGDLTKLQAQVIVEALRPAFDLMRQEIERAQAAASTWLGDAKLSGRVDDDKS
jgi:transcriptional regulator with XRE-family HTH domain